MEAFEKYKDNSLEPPEEIPEAGNSRHEAYDKFILVSNMLPAGDSRAKAMVIRQEQDADGNLFGNTHQSQILILVYMKCSLTMNRWKHTAPI